MNNMPAYKVVLADNKRLQDEVVALEKRVYEQKTLLDMYENDMAAALKMARLITEDAQMMEDSTKTIVKMRSFKRG